MWLSVAFHYSEHANEKENSAGAFYLTLSQQ